MAWMNWRIGLAALGMLKMVACTVPNPDYTVPGEAKTGTPATADNEFLDPVVKGPLEVILGRGESLGDNPGEVGDEWGALEATAAANQWLAFSDKSGVAGKGSDGNTLNFPGGSNLFKYVLDFKDGVDISSAKYLPAKGVFGGQLNLEVNIIGERYRLEWFEFNKSTGEMWLYFDSVGQQAKTMVMYDDNVHSDKYSKRKTTVNGVPMTNLDVKIEADLESGKLARVNVRHQLFPHDNLNIRVCESAKDHVDPYSLLGGFDIYHKGKNGCTTKPAYNAVVADTTGF